MGIMSPFSEMHATACWLTIPTPLIQPLPFPSGEKIKGSFGLAYLLHHVSPLFMMCDLRDVGVSVGDNLTGESVPPRDILPRVAIFDENPVFIELDFEPNVFIHDNYPGGIGLSPALFDLEKDLLKHVLKTINVCP
jgi:DEAD/DEAH box helicase domain-containing protein